MKNKFYFICVFLIITSCSATKRMGGVNYGSPSVKQELTDQNTFKISSYSQDKTYGYDQKNPIMVGGVKDSEGPLNERRFLNALAGPNGEDISYHRIGSCCAFNTNNGSFGGGMLDSYSVSYEEVKKPITLYINMYDSDTLKVPVGFKLKN